MTDFRFTPAQRRAILSGKAPSVKGKGKCPLERGDIITLTGKVSIRIDRVRIPRGGGWSVAYTRIDFRELYLMPSNRKIALNDYGEPMEMTEAEEHGMNANLRDPLDAGPVLDARYQTVVSMSGRLKKSQAPALRGEIDSQVKSFKERLRTSLLGLSPTAQTILLAKLERDLAEMIDAEEEAA